MSHTHPSATWTSYLHPPGRPGAARPDEFDRLMRHPRFPRTAAYDPMWVFQNLMGPHPLWLMEELAARVGLHAGDRVLDLGCGSAITSIFLARELGVRVDAADLWIEPTSNLARIREAGVEDLVVPIEAEAHSLPFAHRWFDAVVSVDSYHYFGTDVRYLSYLSQFVRPGGRIGIAVPGNAVDPDDLAEDEMGPWREHNGADWFTFRSATWWERHWRRTNGIVVDEAAMLEDGWDLWHRHHAATAAWNDIDLSDVADERMLNDGHGRQLGFALVVATVTGDTALTMGPGRHATRLA